MNRFVYILSFVFLLSSCDKISNVKQKLEGEWNIIEYQYRNFESLVYIYDCSGIMTFSDGGGSNCDYITKLDYVADGVSKQKYESGYFEFFNDQYFTNYSLEPTDTYSSFEDGRVIAITKNDVKIAMVDELGEHLFILER